MLYRIEESIVIIDSIFHELQDYEGTVYCVYNTEK